MSVWVSACLCGSVFANEGQLVCDSEGQSVYTCVGKSVSVWVSPCLYGQVLANVGQPVCEVKVC